MSEIVRVISTTLDADVANARWEAYQAAATKAQSTLVVEDGLAAGRAWRAFLDAFLTDSQRYATRNPFAGRS